MMLVTGIWGVMGLGFGWSHAVKAQLLCDRKVGKSALEIKRLFNTLEAFNRTIRMLRAALAADLEPASRTQLMTALSTAVRIQGALLLSYYVQPIPLPPHAWTRPPPDLLGERPLEWRKPGQPHIQVVMSKEFRHSWAVVFRKESKDDLWNGVWSARWGSSPD